MKQYLLICDESGMAHLKKVFSASGIQYLEVQGMPLGGNANAHALVTPMIPPVTPMPIPVIEQPPAVSQSVAQPESTQAQ